MLDIHPATAARFIPPMHAFGGHAFAGDDENEVLDAVPHHVLNQADTWELPAADEIVVAENALRKAANYYRGAFIDIIA